MKRSELYALVWDQPMMHAARQLGLSGHVLRKLCVDHGIPLPPPGYWAKRAHGKASERPSLPEASPSILTRVNAAIRRIGQIPLQIADAQIGDYDIDFEVSRDTLAPVPTPVQRESFPGVLVLQRLLENAQPDANGFLHVQAPTLPEVRIGPGSVQRAILFIDRLIDLLLSLGHRVMQDEGFQIDFGGECLSLKVYETRRKTGSGTDEAPDGPSGNLCVSVFDARPFRWSGSNVVGYWYDRPGYPVETRLGDIVARATESADVIRQARQSDAQARTAQDNRFVDLRQQATEREQIARRRAYLTRKAGAYREYQDLLRFAEFLQGLPDSGSVQRLKQDVGKLIAEHAASFTGDALATEITAAKLYSEES